MKYTLTAKSVSGSRGVVYLKCDACGETFPVKNNEGIVREILRLAECFKESAPVSCKNEECENHAKPFCKSLYVSFGKNSQGSRRWKCRACGRTFAEPTRTTIGQRLPWKNVSIYKLLVNKAPIARICEIEGIGFKTFYHRLNFIHTQSLAFSSHFEKRIPQLKIDRLYLAVDRQDYVLNWSGRKDKRNVTLNGLGTADLRSGYVLGMHINFDPALDPKSIEEDAVSVGDPLLDPAFRKYSWLLLECDYMANTAEAARRRATRAKAGGLIDKIEAGYSEVTVREDIEASSLLSATDKLPSAGMQVRADYLLYAHFFYLRSLLRNVGKVRFFMDQESGIRAACLGAFAGEIKSRTCDAFYVRLGKEMTVDEKRRAKKEAERRFLKFAEEHPEKSQEDVILEMMKEEMRRAAAFGKWSDRWVIHPWPDSAEPEKAMCHLTNFNDMDEDHMAALYLKGSLHAIDRYFMLLRRRVSLLERSIGTSSKAGRSWYGYSAYSPGNVQKVLDIFRTFHNFCKAGRDRATPAMRLGLADRVYSPSEVLSHM